MEFLKLVDVKLNAAGYLVSTQTDKPVNNEAFVRAQNEAHLFVSIANECKGRVFKSSEVVSVFSDIVDKSFEKIRVKRDENKNLVLLRDSLLPKLMSGEIRVPLDEEGDVS